VRRSCDAEEFKLILTGATLVPRYLQSYCGVYGGSYGGVWSQAIGCVWQESVFSRRTYTFMFHLLYKENATEFVLSMRFVNFMLHKV
jgi:hypothetical protein